MSSSKKIVILYGSETGNAHDFATILSHRLHRWHFPHTFCSIGDYNPQEILKCKYLFVICSTTGQGELPKNVNGTSKREKPLTLWSFLKKKNLPSDLLNHVQTAMFGLGDSSYPKFNYAIRKLHQRIVTQLGAKEIFDRLEADDQAMAGSNKGTGLGVESVYFEYEKKVLQFLLKKFPNRKLDGQEIKREELDPKIYLEPISYLQFLKENMIEDTREIKIEFEDDESTKIGRVNVNKRITCDDHFQDVRQFTFSNIDNIQEENYEPGDTAAIYPCNNDVDVSRFLANQSHWLEVADKPLNFTNGVPNDLKDGGLVKPLTLRNLLKYHCDFMSIPRTSFFMKTWTFATDVTKMERGQEQLEDQREKLRQFATDQDMQDLYDYCNRPRRSILEVLEDFLSVRLPWKYALDYLPIIKPRYYSISSGPRNPNIELTVAVVKYKTILRKIRRGICTNYIARLQEGEQLRYKLQNNHLIKKEYQNQPIILVGPGVGLAPLLSVIKAEVSEDMRLFFGCRYKEKDYIYKDTLEDWSRQGKIALFTSFSRDSENSPGVKYVQDYLWKLGEELTDLVIKKNAIFFLCGSSGKMPIQVRLTFIEMLKKWGGFSNEEAAKKYLKEMEKFDRYIQETW
ncbi:tah18p [Saccharomyces arboricola H-6]|uniref:NADPH-dependent diflavin oxidoreductase 1 n=1 Tax=Saccharomyces arboricola (strain H-6 / AS 2.3317 / CBS 10644) TaxID=1160507 RepID=J8PVE9_SACAR|nr:tah18p [Saccharomyces arboricola H-6]